VSDLIRSIIVFALVVALIVGVEQLYKFTGIRATVDANDASMAPSGFGAGGHRVRRDVNNASGFKGGEGGDVIAYWVPTKPDTHRVAHVLAVEGDRVEIERKNPSEPKSAVQVKVNGQLTLYKIDATDWRFPEIRVPRGCVFVLADTPSQAQDSMTVGPIPFYCIMGKVK
jgi:signal peptidase I